MARNLCVFSRILGWRVFGRYVDEQLAAYSSSDSFDVIDYDASVFRYRVPWYLKLSDTAATAYRLGQLMRDRSIEPARYDAFLFQGHDLAAPLAKRISKPMRIIADTTPAITKRRATWRSGLRSAVKRGWAELDDARTYRPMFARTQSFLVLSDLVKQSLIEDYGVAASKVFTCAPPIYDEIASLGRPAKTSRPTILFVGNDFERKGGFMLIDLYERYFRDSADLHIVSNGLREQELVSGIRVFSDLPHRRVLEMMLESHVFVFPSYHDELGLVLAEAACAGLPIVARESGGQSQYVHDGQNGFLLSPADDIVAWRDAVESILSDKERWQRFSRYSRSLGAKLCTRAQFREQFAGFMD